MFEKGSGEFQNRLSEIEINTRNIYINRLNRLFMVQNRNIAVEIIPDRFDLRTVVDIFKKVNRNGTPLNQVDLTISFMSLNTPNVRDNIGPALENIRDNRYRFDETWFLRCLNALVNNRAALNEMYDLSNENFQWSLKWSVKHMRKILLLIQSHLGLDHDHVLFGKTGLIVLLRYLHINGGIRHRKGELASLLYWYVNAAFWGRYSGSSIHALQQDLNVLVESKPWKEQINDLVANLQNQYGEMKLWHEIFWASTTRTRAYPLLYLLTRVHGAKDFGQGVPLSPDLMKHSLHKHHLFPQAYLRRHNIDRTRDIHNVANMTFLLDSSNSSISDRPPMDYFPEVEDKFPGVLRSHFIPEKQELWAVERYFDFLHARRVLLRDASNKFLAQLKAGILPSH